MDPLPPAIPSQSSAQSKPAVANEPAQAAEPAIAGSSCSASEETSGLWLCSDLAHRTRPAGWERTESELAWLRDREVKPLLHYYLDLADSALAPAPEVKGTRRKRPA